MNCWDCRYQNRCDGATCYYDHLKEIRESQPGYDEKKWYMVDDCRQMAFTDEVHSQREIDDYHDKNPNDDMNSFMTKEQIENDDSIRWDTDESWYEQGKKEAQECIKERGLKTVYRWYMEVHRKDFTLKSELGFYDEIMRQAKEAGLRK